MKIAVMMVAMCLMASPVGAFEDGWGTQPDPWPNFEQDYDVWAPTTRESVNPYDYLPPGFEAQRQQEYENQQYRSRYGGCSNMYDHNPAAKEACLQGLGR